MTWKGRVAIAAIVLLAIVSIAATQVTIFVVPRIGAVPDGRTLVINRLTNTNFIDSPDAICERIQDGVSLLCRGLILARVADEATVFVRLPYSHRLYLISTDGREYDR